MQTQETEGKKPKKRVFGRFLKWFLVIVVLFVAIVIGFAYFNLYLPIGSGPAGPSVPAEPFKHIWSEKKVLLLGMGDSITVGVGAFNGMAYFDRLVTNPQGDCEDMAGKTLSALFPKLMADNKAAAGTNSIHHLGFIKDLETQSADLLGIVVMTSGGNDLIHSYGRYPPEEGAMYGATVEEAAGWIDNYEKRLEQMIVELTKKFPGGCHIFLANIYDPSDDTGKTTIGFWGLPAWADAKPILQAYNKIISECAARHDNVHLVDIHAAFLGHGIHCRKFWGKHYRSSDPSFWYYYIVEDPNPRGYDAIRRLFLNEMIEVFYPENQTD